MNLYGEVVSGRQCVWTGGFSHLLHVRKEHTIQHNTTLGNILHSAAGARGFDKCHLLLRRMTTTSLFIFVSISMCFLWNFVKAKKLSLFPVLPSFVCCCNTPASWLPTGSAARTWAWRPAEFPPAWPWRSRPSLCFVRVWSCSSSLPPHLHGQKTGSGWISPVTVFKLVWWSSN